MRMSLIKILSLLVFTLLIGSFFTYWALKPDLALSHRDYFYQATDAFLQRQDQNIEQVDILLIGDSHIHGLATSQLINAVNFGIGSDTSTELIRRFQQYQTSEKAKCLVIQIGINDIMRGVSVDKLIANMSLIFNQIPEHKSVIINSLFNVAKQRNNSAEINKKVDLYNQKVANLLNNKKNIHFLDINTLITNEDSELFPQFHLKDGLHLSPSANKKWLEKLSEKLHHLECNE